MISGKDEFISLFTTVLWYINSLIPISNNINNAVHTVDPQLSEHLRTEGCSDI